jgi:hypothetical protein
MYGDPSHANAGEPLPPVRTRWGSGESKTARGGNPLAPVRSGLFGHTTEPEDMATEVIGDDDADSTWVEVESETDIMDPVGPDVESDIVGDAGDDQDFADETLIETYVEVVEEVEEVWTAQAPPEDVQPRPFRTPEPTAEPWSMEPDALWDSAEDEEGGDELLLDVSLDDMIDESTVDADAPEIDADDVTPAQPIPASPEAFTQFLDEAESVRAHPGPLSPWQVGRATSDATDDPRSALRGHEWEALGRALADTLGAAPPFDVDVPETDSYSDVTEDEDEAAVGEVEGLEPIGAGLERDNPIEITAAGSPDLLEELAERLERFAAGIRTEGHYAISRAQLSGDRMDAMLAGFAAGWLAAHQP